MNVMTVTDVVADTQISAKSDPQGSDSQGFASELNRASNAEQAGTNGSATQAQKTANADQPEDRPDGAKKDEKSKDKNQANAALMQGAIPVIVQVQPEQGTVQAGEQNGAAAAVQITAGVAAVQNAQQTGVPTGAEQTLPAAANAVQTAETIVTAAQTAQTAGTAVQTALAGNAQAELPDAATAEDKAQAFASQVLSEIGQLQKAEAQNGKQKAEAVAETPVAETAVTNTSAADTLKVQAQEQKTQTEPVVLQGDAKDAAAVKADGDQASGEKKDQSGSQLQKQDTGIQAQAPVWSAAGGNTAVQFHVPQAQRAEVQQNNMTSIVDQVSTALKENKTEMVVQLKPEHLGGLAITLSMGEDGITAKMVTSQENVQNMIHNQISALQDSLREKGIPVVHMEVVYDQTQNSANFSRNGSNNGQWATPHGNGNQGSYNETEDTVNYHNFMSSYDVLAEHGGSVEFSA